MNLIESHNTAALALFTSSSFGYLNQTTLEVMPQAKSKYRSVH